MSKKLYSNVAISILLSLGVSACGSKGGSLWGSNNICIRKKKKFGGKKLAGAPVYGALAFLGRKFMQKWKMVGIGGKWSEIGFYFA